MKALLILLSCFSLVACGGGRELTRSPYYTAHDTVRHREPYQNGQNAPTKPKEARQYRKNVKAASKAQARVAKASTPRRIGKGAVYAPAAKEVNNAYKPDGPIAQGDSASATDLKKNRGTAVVGSPDATVTPPAPKPDKTLPVVPIILAIIVVALIANRLIRGRWLL